MLIIETGELAPTAVVFIRSVDRYIRSSRIELCNVISTMNLPYYTLTPLSCLFNGRLSCFRGSASRE